MQDILIKAGCFIAIIILGYGLRRLGFFQESDFKVLSKIALKITLPAAIITNFSGKEIDPSMLIIAVLGLIAGLIYVSLGYILNARGGKEQQAFGMVNMSGYNIGNFTMPFVQSFLGPVGVITTSLFDVGNACVCLGGSYSLASIVKGSGKFSVKTIAKSLSRSAAFDCYIVMTSLSLLNISLPAPIVSCAGIIGNANAFVAMLMIGVGFRLSGDRKQLGAIVKVLCVRYSVATILALVFFFLLPFELEMRQTLVVLVFGPIASAAPAFTGDLKGDVGLASAINSIAIVCSIICMVTILLIML